MKLAIVILLLLIYFCACLPSECSAQKLYQKRVGVVSLFPYSPVSIKALNDLPTAIRDKALAHLLDRLGKQFYETLRFTYGLKVNFDDLYRANPNARNYEWKIFTYKLEFTFTLRAVGIAAYEADLWLDTNGNVLKEIDLPAIGHQPDKSKIISFREARNIGKKNGFRANEIELAYREKEDSIVWRLKRKNREGYRHELDISAHTGQVLNSVGYKGISKNAIEQSLAADGANSMLLK